MEPVRLLRAHTSILALALLVFALAPLAALAGDESHWPPPPPQGERRLSIDLSGLKSRLLKLVVDDKRVERAVQYLIDLPGTPKLRTFRMRGDARPSPVDVKGFYLSWAAGNGYRMLVEAWNADRTGLTGLLHKPGEEGGIFAYQVSGVDVLWLWDEGHAPIGPLLAAWFDYPTLKSETEAPPGSPPWHVRSDLPPVYDERLSMRVEIDRWEIDSIAHDLEASREKHEEHEGLRGLLEAAPEMLATVRHAWFLTYDVAPGGAREILLAPWLRWAEDNDLTSVAEGDMGGTLFEFLIRSGEDGGVVLTMEDDQKVHLLVLDGGPHMGAVSDLLSAAIRASQSEE